METYREYGRFVSLSHPVVTYLKLNPELVGKGIDLETIPNKNGYILIDNELYDECIRKLLSKQ